MSDATKQSISLDKYTLDRMEQYCGEGKEFRSKASLIRYAIERFLDQLESKEK